MMAVSALGSWARMRAISPAGLGSPAGLEGTAAAFATPVPAVLGGLGGVGAVCGAPLTRFPWGGAYLAPAAAEFGFDGGFEIVGQVVGFRRQAGDFFVGGDFLEAVDVLVGWD